MTGTEVIQHNLLVLHTGGTIGMRPGPRGFAPSQGAFLETIAGTPQLHDPAVGVDERGGRPRFTTPPFAAGVRVRYEVLEYAPLLDSANLELSHWARLAEDLGRLHDHYDGFVVLHGTDTMAFTASALSFMLEGFAKPVVLTGAQIPLGRLRNDALGNLLGAIELAALHPIPEVTLFFHHRLLRGNRARKHDASSLDAFDSPNLPPLATVGIHVQLNDALILPADPRPLRVRTGLSPHVGSLRLYPGITCAVLENLLRPPLEGLVLETYGAGNGPERADLLALLREASTRGVLILNVTQCSRGHVRGDYQAGRALAEAGVIAGGDLTSEAAMAKLALVLGQRARAGWTRDAQVRLLQTPLRGEMSS